MTALRSEIKRGLPIVSQPSLGVSLDRNDLAQLVFLERVGKTGRLANPRQTVCLPRHQMTDDLSQLLSSLKNAGRITVEQRLAKRSYTPQQSGTMVIRPRVEDATVLETFNDVDLPSLRPLLDFQRAHPNLLKSATLFPNISNRGLKGISLQFDPSQRDWWRSLSEYSWPFSRGLITAALPMDAEEFMNRSDDILPIVSTIGRTRAQIIKYIRFFYKEDDSRVFMAIAAGPDYSERNTLSRDLHNIHKHGKALHLMKSVEETCYNRRQGLVALMNDVLGLDNSPEEVSNTPFVMLDIEKGQAVSGGVGLRSDLLPFTLSDRIIIHRDPSDRILPFGLKRGETKSPLPGFISPDSVDSFVNTLQHPFVLRDLALGYHPAMEFGK